MRFDKRGDAPDRGPDGRGRRLDHPGVETVARTRIHFEFDGDARGVRARRQRFAGRRRNGLVLRTDLDEQWNAGSVRDGGARRGRSAGPGSVRKLTIAVIGDRDRKRRPYVEAEGRRRRWCVRVLNDCRENRRSAARTPDQSDRLRTDERLLREIGLRVEQVTCSRRARVDPPVILPR